MAGLTPSSGVAIIFRTGARVQARREDQVAHCPRGGSDESGAGFHPAG
jgi:hypothetical protein